ncbi:MAG: endonuclease/exonuclease/phosphatase family protein [Arenicellales bacterium]|nr:endonuclease/exonuclease/phosphatase family protein [Arenicellales bacterium]
MRIIVASYNIQFGLGQDGVYNLDRIVSDVKDADIICLQEVTTNWQACNGDNQPHLLTDRLNMFGVYQSAFELDSSYRKSNGCVVNKRRTFGNMVLSRWPITYSRSHSLSRPPTVIPDDFKDPRTDLPRNAVEAVIDIPGTPVRVISVHLSHLPGSQRVRQVETLRDLLFSLPNEASLWEKNDTVIEPWTQGHPAPPVAEQTILAGDFNFTPDDPEYVALLGSSNGHDLVDGWLAARQALSPHPATCVELDGSGVTLDYIFLTSEISNSVVRAEVRNNTKASDHFPLICELEL